MVNERDDVDRTIRAARDLKSLTTRLDRPGEQSVIDQLGEISRRYDVMISLTVTPYDHDVASAEDVEPSA